MGTIYEIVLTFALAAWVVGISLLQPAKRSRGIKAEYPTKAERPRWFVPVADRLLERTSMVPIVVLPLMTSAFLVLAFVSGELNDLEVGWWVVVRSGSDVLSSLQWVFSLVYVGLAALIVAAVGFLLRTAPGPTEGATHADDGSLVDLPEGKIEWPWVRHGGARRWAARGCGIGAWLLTATAVVLVPTVLNLVFEIVGAGSVAADPQPTVQ